MNQAWRLRCLTAPLPGCLQVSPGQLVHCSCSGLLCRLASAMGTRAACRYAVADSPEALYVAFVGTKQRRDYWTLAAIRQQPMWPEDSSEAVSRMKAPAVSCGRLSDSGSFGRLRGGHLLAPGSCCQQQHV